MPGNDTVRMTSIAWLEEPGHRFGRNRKTNGHHRSISANKLLTSRYFKKYARPEVEMLPKIKPSKSVNQQRKFELAKERNVPKRANNRSESAKGLYALTKDHYFLSSI